MAAKVPARSILKQPAAKPTEAAEAKARAEKDKQNYQIALAHAYRIQGQKDWSDRILKAIELLVEYPQISAHTFEEANNLIKLIEPFQPSDLDALIEERNVEGRCGYSLCSKAPRSATIGKDAVWKVGEYAQQFCSSGCARKSAYLRTQLSEVPVWERDPSVPITILLPEEDRPAEVATVPQPAQKANGDLASNMNELALERGEQVSSVRPKQVMTDRIVEKAKLEHKPAYFVDEAYGSSTAIEGYEPKVRSKVDFTKETKDDSDEDDEDG